MTYQLEEYNEAYRKGELFPGEYLGTGRNRSYWKTNDTETPVSS